MTQTAAKAARAKRAWRVKPTGPKALRGSPEAKRVGAVVLEVLSGLRGPQEGADTLGVSLSRYYALETQGLQGLLLSLEPRPRGPRRTPEQALEAERREVKRLEQELGRTQALLRAAQRALGIAQPPKASRLGGKGTAEASGKKRRRRRRPTVRAARAIAVLRGTTPAGTTTSAAPPAATPPPGSKP